MLTRKDRLLAVAVGLTFSLLMLGFGVSGADPSTWENFAEAAGLRPPHELLPGLWRLLVGWTFRLFGVRFAMGLSGVVGAFAAGLTLAVFYLIVRMTLSGLARFTAPQPFWSRVMEPFFALTAAMLLGASSPFWLISQTFSNDLLLLLMTVVGVYWSLAWIRAGGILNVCLLFGFVGMLAAETPLWLLVGGAFVAAYRNVWTGIVNARIVPPESFIPPEGLPKWRMFFSLLIGFNAMAAVNAWLFTAWGGSAANGWEMAASYVHSAVAAWRMVISAASLLGWVLGMSFAVLPLVVALKVFPSVTRDDRPMGFRRGSIMFLAGFLALLQCGLFAGTRFWTFLSETPIVPNGYLLALFVTMAVFAAVIFLSAFAFACAGRYVARPNADGIIVAVRLPAGKVRHLVPALTLGVVLVALCRMPKSVEREVASAVNAAVAEIVAECHGVKWLFTDGRLDAAIELAAAAAGQELKTFNMMADKTDWEVHVRTSPFVENSDDFLAAETGAPMLLRQWVESDNDELKRTAIMLGFEFWRREKKTAPRVSGMLARTQWESDAAVSNGIVRADELARRVVAIAPSADATDLSPALASAFSAVNWRLARCSHFRHDDELGDELDAANSALERMISVLDDERQRAFMQVSPREGVKLALYRTNFSDGVRYASVILNDDELDPEANFLMGMNAIRKKNYAEAELYLRNCLKRRPKEPAVLNNLSIVCRKQRKYGEALAFAQKAIALLPNSTEVKRTLSDAQNRRP